MARKSYINRRRTLSDQAAAALEGPATPPAPAAIPDLLARAVALVEAHPALVAWEEGQEVAVGETGFGLRRVFRHGSLSSSNIDIIVLYTYEHNIPAFPVATLVGTQYRAMTDIAGFQQWMKLQGVG